MSSSKELKIGVLLTAPVQLLDFAPIDLFAMATPEYLSLCNIPPPIVSLAKPCKIYNIGKKSASSTDNESDKDRKIQQVTATSGIVLTHTTADKEVAPGNLDVLFLPGPDPNTIPDEETQEFLRAHNEHNTTILVICTAAYTAGYSGIYDGRHASGPKFLIPELQKKFPKAKWNNTLRWVQDGNIWSAGGITNGNDLVAAYLRATYPGPVAEMVCTMADVGDRALEYDVGMRRGMLFVLWQVIKALPSYIFRLK
ncbi:ThiJ/PfpI family protein [Talaromyces proteolyticus]|uniref:ThiJ/PfpI family protein n=1 Tax=Talaromyces proteolyticus TaxID=1131652 RepID=A0AAD4Q4Y0_9EURO|nr:ThiJ/PfpI family protein [Talaromyces proteolyticus]KAH8703731.1 ThiJ/PfpI family protein [Talaromyces proteolyticus]